MSNFNEKDHPRGQPDNKGQFVEKNEKSQSNAKTVSAIRKYSSDPERDLTHGDIPSKEAYKELTADELKAQLQQELPEDNAPTFGSQEELNKLLGEEFKGVKGQAAVDKLLQEKRGHVKGAFHRDDMGDIDLIWGDSDVGLQHAIEQRMAEKNGEAHAQEMLENLSEAITQGVYNGRNKYGNFEFVHKKNGAEYWTVIAPEYHNNKLTYILTAFRRGKSKKQKAPN